MSIHETVEMQRVYFHRGKTKSVKRRRLLLLLLKARIKEHEKDIFLALKRDLNKEDAETYMTEIAMVYEEIDYITKRLNRWTKNKYVLSPISQFSACSYIMEEPYGVALIMAPWNYPFQLTMEPLIGAIAAGNCVTLKTSEYTPNTSEIIGQILSEVFPEEYVSLIEGGHDANTLLLEETFDYIFFTGSTKVGKIVMEKASKTLTPVSLELGGKSPVIIDKTANIPLSAKRIAWGKILNAGQTCIAPDYVLIEREVKAEFIREYKHVIEDLFFENNNYESLPRIINEKHFNRILGLIDCNKLLFGCKFNEETFQITPGIMVDVDLDDKIMGEEIFGPVLPLVDIDSVEHAIDIINKRPKALALYMFSNSKKAQNKVMRETSFGGGCINDTVAYLANSRMPFGGVGDSGMGSYHGKYSFETFSHKKSIVKKHNFVDISVRYAPFDKQKLKLLKKILK